MKSMTGYARRETQTGEAYVLIELKSYNNRYLDINVNTAAALSPIETKVRERIAAAVYRGKVECTIRFRRFGSVGFCFDGDAVKTLADALRRLAEQAGTDEEPTLSHLLRYDEEIRAEEAVDVDAVWRLLEPELDTTLEQFEAERSREGELTRKSLETQLDHVADTVALFEREAERLDEEITDKVRERFEEVLGSRVDEDRVLAEIATLLLKFAVDEEIVRLGGHLEACRSALESREPVGKRLDFLCQELNREVNTIGSKSPIYEINRRVVEAKDAIEKMREQLRNVE